MLCVYLLHVIHYSRGKNNASYVSLFYCLLLIIAREFCNELESLSRNENSLGIFLIVLFYLSKEGIKNSGNSFSLVHFLHSYSIILYYAYTILHLYEGVKNRLRLRPKIFASTGGPMIITLKFVDIIFVIIECINLELQIFFIAM